MSDDKPTFQVGDFAQIHFINGAEMIFKVMSIADGKQPLKPKGFLIDSYGQAHDPHNCKLYLPGDQALEERTAGL